MNADNQLPILGLRGSCCNEFSALGRRTGIFGCGGDAGCVERFCRGSGNGGTVYLCCVGAAVCQADSGGDSAGFYLHGWFANLDF